MNASETLFLILVGACMLSFTAARPRLLSAFASKAPGGMPVLPSDVVKYSQVPSKPDSKFTATTVPKGLLKEHSTKKGTWGVICVDKGTLEYQINEPRRVFELKAPARGIIEPTVLHQVRPLSDDVEFVVEFHRVPGTGPVDEKRD